MANYLPKGFRDYVFERADGMHQASERVAEVYERWGFRRFTPSAVEDADTFGQGADAWLLKNSFRFADRTGELLVLRSDMTLQAARVLSGELANVPSPLRLFYADRVFRNVGDGQGALREVFQAGVELAGAAGPEADAEVVAVTLEALRALGVEDLQVDIGHAEFVRVFLQGVGLKGADGDELGEALQRKDARGVADLRARGVLSSEQEQAALELIEAFGLGSLEAVSKLPIPEAPQALAELKGILDVLQGYGIEVRITFDPGEMRGFGYYTGFFFHVYSPAVGRALATGGRYDGLVQSFGRDLPAVGCAIDLAAVVPAMEVGRRRRIHIVNYRAQLNDALQLARGLRERGAAVSRDIVRRSFEESLAFARRLDMDVLVVLEADGTRRVLSVHDGSELGEAGLEG